ncbi:MAG: hypothetical protein WAK60_12355 [Sedimentisphaerales bacterium]
MEWFKLTIPPRAKGLARGDEPLAIPQAELLNTFAELFMAAAEPKNTALFSSDTSSHTFYICASEQSIAYIRLLVESYSASACPKPVEEKLNILAGKANHVNKLLQA